MFFFHFILLLFYWHCRHLCGCWSCPVDFPLKKRHYAGSRALFHTHPAHTHAHTHTHTHTHMGKQFCCILSWKINQKAEDKAHFVHFLKIQTLQTFRYVETNEVTQSSYRTDAGVGGSKTEKVEEVWNNLQLNLHTTVAVETGPYTTDLMRLRKNGTMITFGVMRGS